MPVPSPVFGWAKTPSGVPIPLSVTESFQSVPDTSNVTVICPSLVAAVECMLDGIDDQFGDDQSEALGVAGRCRFSVAAHLQRDCPIVADHRLSQGLAKLRKIRLEFDRRPGRSGIKLLLHGCNRHDPLMSFLQMTPRFFQFHGPRFHHNDACDNLETIGDTMLKLFKQYVLLPQEIILFALQDETFGDVLDTEQNIGA